MQNLRSQFFVVALIYKVVYVDNSVFAFLKPFSNELAFSVQFLYAGQALDEIIYAIKPRNPE